MNYELLLYRLSSTRFAFFAHLIRVEWNEQHWNAVIDAFLCAKNASMPNKKYEIFVCQDVGLRQPLAHHHIRWQVLDILILVFPQDFLLQTPEGFNESAQLLGRHIGTANARSNTEVDGSSVRRGV